MTIHVPQADLARWIDVGAVTDIPRRGARRVATPFGDIAVFRTGDGAIYALRDRCPHKHGPLSQGIVHGRAVTCPLHAWTIDLATGQPTRADAGKGCAAPYAVQVDGGRVLIATPAAEG
ncbi:nitrite reductase small subunit NirD [Caulobacter sp. KR2-114]|uniref:nitrite reductase small subunit NirD n=1 Tax=Caulobacter sp. KR2-114 TaxID=3400912 RepID=UPI003C0B1031